LNKVNYKKADEQSEVSVELLVSLRFKLEEEVIKWTKEALLAMNNSDEIKANATVVQTAKIIIMVDELLASN